MLKLSINIWELKSGNSAHEHMGIDKLKLKNHRHNTGILYTNIGI